MTAELAALHSRIRACTLCGLHATRTQAVPGGGPAPADIMIVGEAPGFTEDLQGVPFVGPAGKLLDTLLGQIGLRRADVFIANVLKCRPPQNRDPLPQEAETCMPYLRLQFKIVQPKAVLVLGRHALERMLPGVGLISHVHGQFFMRAGVAFMPCYHPAAALHNGGLLGPLQRDFDRVGEYLAGIISSEKPAAGASRGEPPAPAPAAPPAPDAEQLPLI